MVELLLCDFNQQDQNTWEHHRVSDQQVAIERILWVSPLCNTHQMYSNVVFMHIDPLSLESRESLGYMKPQTLPG